MNHQCPIAWSRSGLLAYINKQNNVCVTWLRITGSDAWEYAPPIHVPHTSESKPVSLSWSSTNFDLAIIDELGRIQIASINADGTPKTQVVKSSVLSQRQVPRELDKIVGSHWLNPDKNLIIPKPNPDLKSKPWESVTALGPFHPVKTRGALVVVNGNGVLRLLTQMTDYQYTEIDAIVPGVQYVSHATFLQMGGNSLFLILTNGENDLVVYDVVINWNVEQLDEKATQEQLEPAKVTVRPIASHNLCMDQELRGLVAIRTLGADHIEVRAIYPHKTLHFHMNSAEESLHNAFFELFSTSDPVQPAPYRVWNLSQSSVVDHSEEIIEYMVLRFLVVIVYKSGELVTESLIATSTTGSQTYEPNNILQFDRVNLGFKKEFLKNAKNVCLSPATTCVAVIYHDDDIHEPKLYGVEFKSSINREKAVNVAVALAAGYACTVFNSEQCDDIVICCRSLLGQSHTSDVSEIMFETLASETQRLLNVYLGAPDDSHKVERLVVIPSPIQRWLSFLISLGTGKDNFRTSGCQTALGLLHLQLLAFGITWTLKRVSQKPRSDLSEKHRLEIYTLQYHLQSILGPAQWAYDLIIRICQELYDASMDSNPNERFINRQNVYASLLMSKVSRYLLRYFLRGMRTLSSAAKNLAELETILNSKIQQQSQSIQDPKISVDLKAQLALPTNYVATLTLKKFVTQLQSVPVKLDSFERLIVDIDTKIKALAASQKLTIMQCNKIDYALICNGQLPNEYAPLVNSLVQSSKQILLPVTDVPAMYFHDTAWLGLDDRSNIYFVDRLLKRSSTPEEHMQVCTRCGINSVLSQDNDHSSPKWLMLFLRHCVCGGAWLRFDKFHAD